MSNAAANRQATEEEIQELQLALGGNLNQFTSLECRCVCFERLASGLCLLVFGICLHVLGKQSDWIRYAARGSDMIIAALLLYICTRVLRSSLLSGLTWSRIKQKLAEQFWRRAHFEEYLQENWLGSEIGLGRTEETWVNMDSHSEVMDNAARELHTESSKMAKEDGSLRRGYSIVISRKSWFEVVCTQGFDPLILQISPCLQVDIGACFCAVGLVSLFGFHKFSRVKKTSCMLSITIPCLMSIFVR